MGRALLHSQEPKVQEAPRDDQVGTVFHEVAVHVTQLLDVKQYIICGLYF